MSNTAATGSLYQISSSMITSTSQPATPALSTPQPEKPKPRPKPQPWLIIGLGNPGKRYAGTSHNVGFEMIDTIADAEGISMASVSFKAQFGKALTCYINREDYLSKDFPNLDLESRNKFHWRCSSYAC